MSIDIISASKKLSRLEASIIDNHRQQAAINFSLDLFAALRPRRHVLFLDKPRNISCTHLFFPLLELFFLMGCLMTSSLPPTGKSLDCLLPEPGLMPQSLSSEVSGVHPIVKILNIYTMLSCTNL